MSLFHCIVFFASLLSTFVPAQAEIYVINPASGGTCSAGKSCTVQWVDDGVAPTLSSIGACTVGLYHGNEQLVQTLEPVNIAASASLTFTPQAQAGPNSKDYYIAFISTSHKVNGSLYVGYSPNFSLTGMSGNFASPVASLTATRAVAASLSTATGDVPISTISRTETISFSSYAAASTSSSRGLTTSRTVPASSATASSVSNASNTTSTTSGAVRHQVSALALVLLTSLMLLL